MMINEIILQVQYSQTNLVIAAFTSIITVLGVYIKDAVEKSLSRRRLRKEEEKKNEQIDRSLQHNSDIQKKIKEILIQLQGYTECSRACLYAYHNGTKTHFGFSMNFVSMIEEKTDGIVAPLIDTFQNIPAGYFRTILDKVDKSQEGYAVIETDELDGDDKRMMERYQIAMSYDFKIGGTVYEGMVSLVWVNKKQMLSEEQIDHIQQLVDLIYYLQKDIQKLPKF
jgi:hypothetical protein